MDAGLVGARRSKRWQLSTFPRAPQGARGRFRCWSRATR